MTSPKTTNRCVSRKKVIKELKDAAKDATDIYIATDPDREGEAIGWHLKEELAGKKRKFHRLTFNEITKKAVEDAFKHPRDIDTKMVAAQRARRVLDRLVGYKISPLLWDKVRRGSERRPSAIGGAEAGLRPRAGDRAVRSRGVLEHLRASRGQGSARVRCQAAQEKRRDDQGRATRTQSKAVLADLEQAEWVVTSGHDQGTEAARAAALHHHRSCSRPPASRSRRR